MRFGIGWATVGLLTAVATVSGDARAAGPYPVWPADSAWNVLLNQNGMPVTDVVGDATQPYLDIVGPNDPAVYVYSNGMDLFFRIRLDGSPLQSPAHFSAQGWGCLINTDPADPTSYQWMVMVQGNNQADFVGLTPNTMAAGNALGFAPSGTTVTFAAWDTSVTPSAPGYARSVPAPTSYSGTPDAFIDFAVPLVGLTGVTAATPLRFVCGTSTNKQGLTSDVAGTGSSISTVLSPPYECGVNGCSACNTASACGATCVACVSPQVCAGALGGCAAPTCTGNSSCSSTPATPVCDTRAGHCVQCVSGADCTVAGLLACNTATNTCVQCTGNSNCSSTPVTPVCDTTTNLCVGCITDSDCASTPATPVCNAAGVCVICTSSAQCPLSAPVCSTTAGTCGACTANNDCPSTAPYCNSTTGACNVCTTDSNCGSTTSGMVCDAASGTCVAGCDATDGGNGCPAGLTCSSTTGVGTCRAPSDGGTAEGGAADGGVADGAVTDGGATDSGADSTMLADATTTTDGAASDGAADATAGDSGMLGDSGFEDATAGEGGVIERGSVGGGGCSCTFVQSDDTGAAAGALALTGALLLAHRRRRRTD